MKTEIFIIGTGGQHIKTIGKIIAQAAVLEGLGGTTFYSSYTPDPRGDIVISSIIVAEKKQIYPLPQQADFVFVFSTNAALEAIKNKIKQNTILVSVDSEVPAELKYKQLIPVNLPSENAFEFMQAIIQETIALISNQNIVRATQEILNKKLL